MHPEKVCMEPSFCGVEQAGVSIVAVLKIIFRYGSGVGPEVQKREAPRRLASLRPPMPLVALPVVLQ